MKMRFEIILTWFAFIPDIQSFCSALREITEGSKSQLGILCALLLYTNRDDRRSSETFHVMPYNYLVPLYWEDGRLWGGRKGSEGGDHWETDKWMYCPFTDSQISLWSTLTNYNMLTIFQIKIFCVCSDFLFVTFHLISSYYPYH